MHLTLDAKGSRIFRDVTRENIGKRMAILLFEKGKGEVVTAPVIRSEIGGGRVVLRTGQAGRVGEARVRHAEALRLLVHLRDERLLAAPDQLGQRNRGVVARLDDQTVKQFVDGGRAGRIDEHPRADRLVGIGRDRRACVQGELLVLDRIEGEIGGHQLGERRRLDPHVGVACGQQLTGGEIHEQP